MTPRSNIKMRKKTKAGQKTKPKAKVKRSNVCPAHCVDEQSYSELQRLLEVIERAKQMWQATFDAIRDPVIIISQDFDIERANLSTSKMSGTDIKGIIGKKCYKAFAGRENICEGCPLSNALDKNSACVSKLNNRIGGRDFEASAYPYPGGETRSKAAVIHYRDISEEKRLQQELIQQEKMAAIGMLAGGVAHEINNPLGGILAFTQLIMRELKEEDPIKADLSEVEKAAIRCKKIVADLLDFSRSSSGHEKHLLDVNLLIEKIVPFIKTELKSYNVNLKLNLMPDLPKVNGSPNRLQQVFLNLLTNACQSMAHGGDLVVRTYKAAEDVCVAVEDTGHGISPEHLSKVFDPFFTTKAPGKGTGLGLSISYRIIKEHDGLIKVESEKEVGTRFTVRLPAVK